jgi:hypothetical protein
MGFADSADLRETHFVYLSIHSIFMAGTSNRKYEHSNVAPALLKSSQIFLNLFLIHNEYIGLGL